MISCPKAIQVNEVVRQEGGNLEKHLFQEDESVNISLSIVLVIVESVLLQF